MYDFSITMASAQRSEIEKLTEKLSIAVAALENIKQKTSEISTQQTVAIALERMKNA